ncbi:MAG: septal ring lytic transglycosylase RlpA family protein [Acidobacteriota bacterium]
MAAATAGCSGYRGSVRGGVVGRGVASWYGGTFHGRQTANGERYDMHGLTAAHKTLPFGTVVEVRNLDNGRSVRVRINDRGPFVRGRIIDLSYAAARRIEMIGPGTAHVELVLVRPADGAVQARAGPGPTAPVPAARGDGGDGPWTVQVGAFRERRRADDLRTLLARHFPEAEVRSADGWHRVQVGRFERKGKARRLRGDLRDLGWEAVVVPLP